MFFVCKKDLDDALSLSLSSCSFRLAKMLEALIQSPVHPSLEECLSSSLANKMLNFDDEENLFEEAGYSTMVSSLTNNVDCSSDVPATATFPTTGKTADLPCYDDSDLLSVLLNPQPSPEPEPDILPSFPVVSMAPIHAMDHQYNPMISNPSFTSYTSQLPLDHLGLPEYMGMEPSTMQHCTFLDANGRIGAELYADGMGMPTCVADDEMLIYGSVAMPVRPMEATEAYGVGGIYTYGGAMSRLYNPAATENLQVLGDSQQHIMPMCSTSTLPLQVTSDIPTMEESNYKACRASAEERKEMLDRYTRKKKKRNFTKKIKYACRKTLADSRPRVRGRFAKNNEFGEVAPTPSSANDGYDDEESQMASGNDEDILTDSSDILAHISGVNSFGFHHPVESWI